MSRRSSTARNSRLIGHRQVGAWIRSMVALVLVFANLPTSWAYEQDSHYFLRFGLSLATCFNWDETHLIASGDWGMDENGSTHAEMNPFQTKQKIAWHAFGHSDSRFSELWIRAASEEDLELRLIKLGQFMHFLEDWEAHDGYGIRLGHARDTFAGRDPDSLGSSMAKNHRMVQSALDHLLATCVEIGRLAEAEHNVELTRIIRVINDDGLMEDLFHHSDPQWKQGKLGGFRDIGPEIKTINKVRIEQLIQSYFAEDASKQIPASFAPGTAHGIPPSLALPFDADGSLAVKRSALQTIDQWARENRPEADLQVSLEQVRGFSRRSGQSNSFGWRALIKAENVGEEPSQAGHLEVIVIDSDDENVLAQLSHPLPAFQPGEQKDIRLTLPATQQPEPDVIVGVFAHVGDLSASNDIDWLMHGDAEDERPEVPITVDIDPPVKGQERVELLHPPEIIKFRGQACVILQAVATGGDTPGKLDLPLMELRGGQADGYGFDLAIPGRWSAMYSERGLVGAKYIECFVPGVETRQLLGDGSLETLKLGVTLGGRGLESAQFEFELTSETRELLIELAASVSLPHPDVTLE